MADQGPKGIEITPEEDRFLRAFFHRQAGLYLAGVGLVAVAAVCGVWLLAGPRDVAEGERAELDGLLAENERLQGELADLAKRVAALGAAPDPAGQISRLEQRVTGALRRLERVESRVEQASVGGAPGSADAASWDVSSALDRVSNLEARQEREEKSRETFEKSVLNRLYAVESQRDALANASAVTQQSILKRLGALEKRASSLEKGLGTPPAASAR